VQYAKSDSKILGKLDGILGSNVQKRQIPATLGKICELTFILRAVIFFKLSMLQIFVKTVNFYVDEKEAVDKQPSTISAPNSMLFIENLPRETDEMMLKVLFEKFPGKISSINAPSLYLVII